MKYVFLFSGQGAQFKGMLQDVCAEYPKARQTIDKMSDICGEDIASFLWHTENAELSRSDKSQLAITASQIALCEVLKDKGIQPAAAAGFSLGEFAALYTSGVLSLTDVTKLVCARGKIMQACCDRIASQTDVGTTGAGKITAGTAGTSSEAASPNTVSSALAAPGMAAVIKLSPETVVQLLEPYSSEKNGSVFAANMNSPVQTVVSGTAEGLAEAEKLCMQAGAKRFIRLAVAGPFHSPLMASAAEDFAEVLKTVAFANPVIPLFSNVTGGLVKTGEEAKKNAVLHITHPVRWTQEEKEIDSCIPASERTLLEIGPGTTLCNLWRDSGCESVCMPTGTLDHIKTVLQALH